MYCILLVYLVYFEPSAHVEIYEISIIFLILNISAHLLNMVFEI